MSAAPARRRQAAPPPPAAAAAGAPVDHLAEQTAFFKAFCSETRAGIIEYLMGGEKCVCEIVAHVGDSQPLVSHHLAVLRATGFVRARGAGARTYYAIDWTLFDEKMAAFTQTVAALRIGDAGPSCACG